MEQTNLIQYIPVGMIQPSAMNPRKTFDQESLQELADNIKRQGLLQPITVRPIDWRDDIADEETKEIVSVPTKYEIVCGERRWRAVKLNGSETIPCIVRLMDDATALDAMITENLQRKDVDPIEEAFAFALLHYNGNTVEEIASRFGKSARFVRERIKLDSLIPEMKKWVSKGLMDIGAAVHIAKLTEESQRKFMEQFETDEDVNDEELEPITKQDAVSFTDDLFKRIESAIWSEGYKEHCGCTCDLCEFNSSNEGCLFNDLKVSKENACCTNHELWTGKRLAWLKHTIDKHAAALVKHGEELAPGKMVLAHSDAYYNTTKGEYNSLKDYCTEQGYLLVKVDETFERWNNLHREEETTKKKLVSGEAYVVLLIDSDYRGARVDMKCFTLRKQESKNSAEAANVAQLVRQYQSNIDTNKGTVALEMRKSVSEYDINAISWKALTDEEWAILLTMLINSSSYDVKDAIMGRANKEAEFAKENNTPEGRDMIIRKWIRCKLSDSGVQYYPVLQECQERIIKVWGIDDAEVKGRAAARLRKKQEKIEKSLRNLGYDTDGQKLAF